MFVSAGGRNRLTNVRRRKYQFSSTNSNKSSLAKSSRRKLTAWCVLIVSCQMQMCFTSFYLLLPLSTWTISSINSHSFLKKLQRFLSEIQFAFSFNLHLCCSIRNRFHAIIKVLLASIQFHRSPSRELEVKNFMEIFVSRSKRKSRNDEEKWLLGAMEIGEKENFHASWLLGFVAVEFHLTTHPALVHVLT